MFSRVLSFFGLQCAALALGLWYGDAWGALAGVLLLSWLWFGWNAWRVVLLLAWLRRDDPGAVPRIGGYLGEAIERVRRRQRLQDQALAASDARLQAFLEALQASPNGVLLLDAADRIQWCNQTAAWQLGLDAQRDHLQSIGNLVREPALSDYLASGDFSQDVLLCGRKSTATHPVRLALRLHPYGEGRRLMLVRDVTALEQAESMRRDFVANVSHELRTPLTVLVGFIETMQTLPLSADEQRQSLDLMAGQAQRMRDLVQDLLALSRLEGSAPPGHDEWTSVRGLLERCEQEARALSQQQLAGNAPHQWQFPSAQQLAQTGEIAGSGSELYSALSNLVSNAVRYTPAGGRILVDWQMQVDGSARFLVRDSGQGIAPEHLPRLTERFYHIEPSRSRDAGGTGLGLAIVKHVAQRHGAYLQINSLPGQGSEFAVIFPATRLRPSEAKQALC